MTTAKLFFRCLKNDAWDCDDCPWRFLCEVMVEEEAMNIVEVYKDVD